MTSVKYLPGLWTRFRQWWNLSRSADKSAGQMVYKGEDLNGNYYFETMDKSGRIFRFVEPKNLKTSDIPMIPEINISPEWIRWLRKTREEPPTEEEMIRNAAIALIKKQKAAQLEMEERKNWPELDAKLQLIEAERDFHPKSFFPLYRDLEVNPGQTYLLNRGFYIADLPDNPNLLEQEARQKLSPGESKDVKSTDDTQK
ncbi:NADH-ubiquinone oxidoreductase assembly factor N7BML [Tetranychus urticae]|uniref:NADH dehydrogenase [ubiquinone] 1 alpha subcomplex subunit 12 n=1 Tax=Tetranychus urticae TaxID=32264 RepID=T1KVP7_TETUR|nr:NADH-ubiquinone oxidoreductase assembly factor N7BML [Tetranychus urticae]